MRLSTEHTGSTFTAHLAERLSFADHPAFRTLIEDIARAKPSSCVFELSELQSIDSAGLGMFLIALDGAKKGGWSLTLRNAQGHVKSLLQLGRFDKLLQLE
ncbi:STAS domain-containing protein [Oryzibacter oryziterrae]|uniref:STAS domain-containing protein n=1 Tax=Oryzibacter oryziterrae TaxID=2766474 RepID=UPI001F37D666|nr:STAS domain-containing protein [Oryzibacter oryziterrae]